MKESEKKQEYTDLARELKKTVEFDGDIGTICTWFIWNGPKRFEKESRANGKEWKNRDHRDHSIGKIG